ELAHGPWSQGGKFSSWKLPGPSDDFILSGYSGIGQPEANGNPGAWIAPIGTTFSQTAFSVSASAVALALTAIDVMPSTCAMWVTIEPSLVGSRRTVTLQRLRVGNVMSPSSSVIGTAWFTNALLSAATVLARTFAVSGTMMPIMGSMA